jgi:Thioesterase superfamily
MGTVHGGILCDVADAAMGIAFVTTLQPDESLTTMSLTINFFRPVWEHAYDSPPMSSIAARTPAMWSATSPIPRASSSPKRCRPARCYAATRQRPADRLLLRGLYLSQELPGVPRMVSQLGDSCRRPARAMVDVAISNTSERQRSVSENRDIRAMVTGST